MKSMEFVILNYMVYWYNDAMKYLYLDLIKLLIIRYIYIYELSKVERLFIIIDINNLFSCMLIEYVYIQR